MKFDDALEMYTTEIDGILFASEDDQSGEYEANMKRIAANYWNNINAIVEFMLPDLQTIYDAVDAQTVKEKLGKPVIDYDNGSVEYCEQTFDDEHIFSFEFLDDEFQELQYFSIDG